MCVNIKWVVFSLASTLVLGITLVSLPGGPTSGAFVSLADTSPQHKGSFHHQLLEALLL